MAESGTWSAGLSAPPLALAPSAPAGLRLETGDVEEIHLTLAATGARSYAFLIDLHIRAVLAAAWGLSSHYLLEAFGSGSDPQRWFFVVLLPSLAIYGLYHPLLEWLQGGRTPGKRFAGLRIVDRQGRPPDFQAVFVRNLFRLLDGLPGVYLVGLLSTMINREHLRIGDLAAGTVLVRDPGLSAEQRTLLSHFGRSEDHRGELSPELRSLLLESTQRWPSLAPAARRPLAEALLQRLGETPPAGASDAALLARLKHHGGE